MKIHGLNKTTLLDYPERVAATIFTGNCNFRCPFCQNGSLVLNPDSEPLIPEEDIFSFLKKRAGILTGVCITGGEPTLQPDLPEFIEKIKKLGYYVKLDTNGYRPDIIQKLVQDKLIDSIAMDIKSSPENYHSATGIPSLDINPIKSSVSYIMEEHIPYEFRTTIVRELHSESDFISIRDWLTGASNYYLQSYKDSEQVLVQGFHAYSKEEIEQFQSILISKIPHTYLRGIE